MAQFPSNFIKRGFVYLHPDDKSVYPKELRAVDPEVFVPPPGYNRNWGLSEPEVDGSGNEMDMIQRFMSKAMTPNLYLKQMPPYEQYIRTLARRKEATVSEPEVQAAMNTTLIIKVHLTECEEDCWRTFTVPAGTALPVMHDQILGPIMGWARGYHGYVFQDPRDGAVMGPKKYSGYIDMMHANLMFNAYMDDRKMPLAAVLQKVGDRCWYTYDLGDHWEHVLEVVKVIHEGEDGYGEVKILDGFGACPPEDSNGLEGKGCASYAEFLQKYKSKPQLCKKALKEAAASTNYQQTPFGFDPLTFRIEFHRILLDALMSSPKVALRNRMNTGLRQFKETDSKCWKCEDKLKPLSKCSKCQVATYCCRECQVADWKAHKEECKQIVAEKVEKDKAGK